jgi:hypothetical protein
MGFTDIFKDLEDEAVFVKTTVKTPVEPSTKAVLNRKGNVLFNDGDIEGARRIFVTTGYSDGLSRVGDAYKSKGRLVDALQMYYSAHNEKKIAEVSMELAIMIKGLIREDD